MCPGSEGTRGLGRVLRASACPGTSRSARSRRRSRERPQPPKRDRAKPEPVFSPGAERGLAAGPAPDILPGNTNRELSQRAGTRAGFGKESRRGARSRAQTRAARRRTYAPQRRRAGRRPPRSESSGGGALPVPRPPAARGESKEKKAERRPTAACFPPRYRSNVTRRRRGPPLRRPRRLLGPGEGRRGPGGEGEEAGPATEATEPSTEAPSAGRPYHVLHRRRRAGKGKAEPLSSGRPTCGSGTNSELAGPAPGRGEVAPAPSSHHVPGWKGPAGVRGPAPRWPQADGAATLPRRGAGTREASSVLTAPSRDNGTTGMLRGARPSWARTRLCSGLVHQEKELGAARGRSQTRRASVSVTLCREMSAGADPQGPEAAGSPKKHQEGHKDRPPPVQSSAPILPTSPPGLAHEAPQGCSPGRERNGSRG